MLHMYMLWAWHASLASLSNTHRTVTLSSAQARNCQQSNAYFESVSLESIPCGLGMLSIDALAVKSMKTVLRIKNFC